jgi:hypothetical protein
MRDEQERLTAVAEAADGREEGFRFGLGER